ncbi:hypothetical protein BLS_009509 [Venturia inaequalis]|uniref:RNase III domain-containing protein n=1 Tax=Venturia inaequalis TaxID=5025 RepID=A0A8H3YUW4_VENIN|nr:hypothetical protein BLS_009509 [Venturia inaequalis]KAE9970016.1 hypothetical protein EG328_006523 [Venturia inaequalis]KAE9979380.1 hypothetical protein EG327_007042 [Venturia inaequalis]RDI80417.1 hypothetical protein Vi05172_g9625 [Venturia inaequalis]
MDSRANVKIAQAEAAIDYSFKDANLIWEALQAPGSGVVRSGTRQIPNGNKRLALVGDVVLKLIINVENYEQGLTRGEGNVRLQLIEGNVNFVRVANANGFKNFINANPGHCGELGARTLADTVEAIIGAVYLDGGIDAVPDVLVTLGLT